MDEELLNRQPPQSLEAEQAVLGSILIDSRCVADVIGIVKPEDFFLRTTREIYETIYTMFNFSLVVLNVGADSIRHKAFPSGDGGTAKP